MCSNPNCKNVLKVDIRNAPLRPVRLASPEDVKTGDKVTIISNPGLGDKILDRTMTDGIVSNPRRELDGMNLMQTTAAINPGSSGGPVFNSHGLVVGLVAGKGRIESASALERTWYDSEHKYRTIATYMGFKEGRVSLRRVDNGNSISMPLEKLSRRDQAFVKLISGSLTPDEN